MVNFFILVAIISALGLLLIALIWVLAIVTGRYRFQTPAEKHAIQKRKNMPKVGPVRQYCVGILLFLLIAMTGKAQPFVFGGMGGTNKFFSAELQAGYRISNSTISIGYTSVQFVSDQPVLFSVRGGHVIADKLHVYGGYARVMYSNDDKSRNSNTWQIGAQYLFCKYDRGSFYIGGNYTGNRMLSGHVGMTYNLIRDY